MRVYLDTCAIQRPADASDALRVEREARAIMDVVALIEEGRISLVSSSVLQSECERNPDLLRQRIAEYVLGLANEIITVDADVQQRSRSYRALGLKPMDAAHLACAVHAGVQFICTCDDKFLHRAQKLDTGLTRVVSPLELIQEVTR